MSSSVGSPGNQQRVKPETTKADNGVVAAGQVLSVSAQSAAVASVFEQGIAPKETVETQAVTAVDSVLGKVQNAGLRAVASVKIYEQDYLQGPEPETVETQAATAVASVKNHGITGAAIRAGFVAVDSVKNYEQVYLQSPEPEPETVKTQAATAVASVKNHGITGAAIRAGFVAVDSVKNYEQVYLQGPAPET